MPNEQPVPYKYIGNYCFSLQDVIGSGYSSTVYIGKHLENQETVAIKVIENQKVTNEVQQFLLDCELKALQKLENPYVLNVKNIYQTSNNTYIVTEFCNNGDLDRIVRKNQRISEDKAKLYITQIVVGFQELVKKRVIHRDLKPANIMLNDETAKIADFGFCKDADAPPFKYYYNVGSPNYMSPQSLRSNQYSFKSDVWSIGALYFEILTGNTPFDAPTEEQLVFQAENIPVKFPKSPILSEDSKNFIRRCMTVNEEKRISPEEMLEHPLIQKHIKQVRQLEEQLKNKKSNQSSPQQSMKQQQLPPPIVLANKQQNNNDNDKFEDIQLPTHSKNNTIVQLDNVQIQNNTQNSQQDNIGKQVIQDIITSPNPIINNTINNAQYTLQTQNTNSPDQQACTIQLEQSMLTDANDMQKLLNSETKDWIQKERQEKQEKQNKLQKELSKQRSHQQIVTQHNNQQNAQEYQYRNSNMTKRDVSTPSKQQNSNVEKLNLTANSPLDYQEQKEKNRQLSERRYHSPSKRSTFQQNTTQNMDKGIKRVVLNGNDRVVLSQINYCRFLFRLAKMTQENVALESPNTREKLIFLLLKNIMIKINKLRALTNPDQLDNIYKLEEFNEYIQTDSFNKFKLVIQEYYIKYQRSFSTCMDNLLKKEDFITGTDQLFEEMFNENLTENQQFYNILQQQLKQSIREMNHLIRIKVKSVQNVQDNLGQQTEDQVVLLDYFVTLYQLCTLIITKYENYTYFAKTSKIEQIADGKPVRLTKQHYSQIRSKIYALDI